MDSSNRAHLGDLIRAKLSEIKSKGGHLDLTGFLDLLKEDPVLPKKLERYPAVMRMSRALDLEATTDFSKAGTERDGLIAQLGRIVEGEDLRQLVNLSLRFKQNAITPADFHAYLMDLAERYQIDLDEAPNLQAFAEYLAIYEAVPLDRILGELESLSSEVIRDLEPPPPLEPGAVTMRAASCDVCGQSRLATVGEDEAFTGGLYLVAFRIEDLIGAITFVASCEKCDIDVCTNCVRWSIVPHPDQAMATRLHADAKCFKSLCPRCGGDLSSKSTADVHRLEKGMRELRLMAFAKRLWGALGKQEKDQARAKRLELSRRLARICTEEHPYLARVLSRNAFEELRRDLAAFGRES